LFLEVFAEEERRKAEKISLENENEKQREIQLEQALKYERFKTALSLSLFLRQNRVR
jgi:hypothetical protein